MIQYQHAIQKINAVAAMKSQSSEQVDLLAAEGRILAEDLFSSENVPSFDNSSMDGFAVCASEVREGLNTVRVLKQIFAGDKPESIGIKNIAVEIMTGAPMPGGAFDAVVKVEDTVSRMNENGNKVVEIKGPIPSGQFVRKVGEDFQKGAMIARAGTCVDARLLMSASAVGVRTLSVFRKPRVWVIATGREVVEYSSAIALGEIRNSSSPYLVSELKRLGCEVSYQGIIKDDVAEYESCLKAALDESVDLVISTGAVSMGVHDFVPAAVEKLGGEIAFHKVAIRPGKPILFATFSSGTAFFGLPGNPISTAVGAQFFVKPYLDLLVVRSQPAVRAQLAKAVSKPEGLRCFYKAHWSTDAQGKSVVEILDGQASFQIYSLVKANAWVVLPESGENILAGQVLDVYPLC